MVDKKKDPNDVSGMTAEERYRHINDRHKDRQAVKQTPHDMRVAAKETGRL